MATKKLQILGNLFPEIDLTGHATKEYVDESILDHSYYKHFPLDSVEVVSNGFGVFYNINIDSLESGTQYIFNPKEKKDYPNSRVNMGKIYLLCDDGSKKNIMNIGSFCQYIYYVTRHSSGTKLNIYYENVNIEVDFTDKSTSNAVIVTTNNTYKYLQPGNNAEYIPITDYSPATKKYVDDNINSLDAITSPSVSKIGQTIVVKAIDENGKPIEWEAVDMPTGEGSSDSVQYVEQELTEEQKMQARKNLGLYYSMTSDVYIIPEQSVQFDRGSAIVSNVKTLDELGLEENGDTFPVILRVNESAVNGVLICKDGGIATFEAPMYYGGGIWTFYIYSGLIRDTPFDADTHNISLSAHIEDTIKIPAEYMDLDAAVEQIKTSIPFVSYMEQELTEEQQMQARANLGLYGIVNEYRLLHQEGPDVPGYIWQINGLPEAVSTGYRIEIWDAMPEKIRFAADLQQNGRQYSTLSGGSGCKYFWGNPSLIKNDPEANPIFSEYTDLVNDYPVVLYRAFDEDYGYDFIRLYISPDLEPSYWIGFTVKFLSYVPETIVKTIPEEYIPDSCKPINIQYAEVGQTLAVKSVDESGKPTEWEAVDMPTGEGSSDAVQYVEQELSEEQQMQARKNLGLYNSVEQPLVLLTGDPFSTSLPYDVLLEGATDYKVLIHALVSGFVLEYDVMSWEQYDHVDDAYNVNLGGTGEDNYPFHICTSRGVTKIASFDPMKIPQEQRDSLGIYELSVLHPYMTERVVEKIPEEYLPDSFSRGADGGHYIPSVTQTDENTMTVSFTASKDGMEYVSDQTITLPTGPKGDPGNPGTNGITPHIGENGNWWIDDTDTGVKATGEASGSGIHIGPNPPEDTSMVWINTDDDTADILPPATEKYELPIAASEVLGGVKADPAEETDTQPVRIGADGKLYTTPGGGDSDEGSVHAPSADEWDVHYKVNIAEALENGFEITEVDGKPLQLKEMWAMVKLQSATDSVWLGCEVTTDNKSMPLSNTSAEHGGVYAKSNDYAYFIYHATVLANSNRAVCEFMASKGVQHGTAGLKTNLSWLNNWLDYNPVNYITGLKCTNNLAAGTAQGYGTEIEIWGKTK